MRQWHCYVGGQQYGPITEDVLREWARTGRLSPTDNVWTEGMADWAPASTVGGLFTTPVGGVGAGPGAGAGLGTGAGAAPGTFGTPGRYLKPHRGATVLTLGILGIAFLWCCIIGLILSIIAWVMGSNDLREIAAGQMDPAGEGTTRGGMICGIIGVALNVLAFVVVLVGRLSQM